MLVGLVVFGVIARLALCFVPRVMRWDEPAYVWLGRSLIEGAGFQISGVTNLHYPPVLPLLFAPLTKVFDSRLEWVGNTWFIVCGALLPLVVFRLGRRMFPLRTALGGAVLTAVFPLLVISPLYWGTLSEPPYLLLLFVGLERAHAAWREQRRRDFAFAGLALVAAYLTRPEGLLALGLVAGFLAVAAAVASPARRRAAFAGLAIFVAVAGSAAAPYLVFLHRATGSWQPTGKIQITLALGRGVVEHDPQKYDEAISRLDSSGREVLSRSLERFELPGFGELTLERPAEIVERVLANLRFVGSGLFRRWIGLLPFVALGCFGILRGMRQGQPADQVFLLLQLLPSLAFSALHIETRFFAPTVPIVMLWTASALDWLGAWLAARTGRWRSLPLWAAALGLLVLYPYVFRHARRSLDFGVEEAGRWLREHSAPDAVVMTRELAVPLYADREFCPSPRASVEATLDYARAHGVTHWHVAADELAVVRPYLRPLLDPSLRPEGLRELVRLPGRGADTVVFSVDLPPARSDSKPRSPRPG